MEELIKQYRISLDSVHSFKKVLLDMREHIDALIHDFNTLMKLMQDEIKIMESNNKGDNNG